MHNPKAKGEKTEAIIIAELIKKDYPVLLPFGDNQRYDLIIEDKGQFKRIQCKTGRLRKGAVTFATCSNRCNTKQLYKKDYLGQIDLFAVYCYENNQIYLVPIDCVGTTQAKLRIDSPKNNQSKKIQWAKDFQLIGH